MHSSTVIRVCVIEIWNKQCICMCLSRIMGLVLLTRHYIFQENFIYVYTNIYIYIIGDPGNVVLP